MEVEKATSQTPLDMVVFEACMLALEDFTDLWVKILLLYMTGSILLGDGATRVPGRSLCKRNTTHSNQNYGLTGDICSHHRDVLSEQEL